MSTSTLRDASGQLHPTQDSSNNNNLYDVAGNKTDSSLPLHQTANDKSLVSYLKSTITLLRQLNYDAVWGPDYGQPANLSIGDYIKKIYASIGAKADAAVSSIGVNNSAISYLKGLITKSDNIQTKANEIKVDTQTIISDVASVASTNVFLNQIGFEVMVGGDYGAQPISGSLGHQINKLDKVAITSTPVTGSVGDYVKEIDNKAVSGLTGVSNSLAYRVAEIERHFHSNERWFGRRYTGPIGTTDVATRIGITGYDGAFEIDAGNNDWGAWVNILGSGDTPVDGSNTYFDFHSIATTANERTGPCFIQVGYGPTGADAIANGTYSERVIVFDGMNARQFFDIQGRRIPVGQLVWIRNLIPSINTGTVSFYFGIHEYEG